MSLSKSIGGPNTRRAGAVSLDASAHITNSGSASTDNASGTSAAAAEILTLLDGVFDSSKSESHDSFKSQLRFVDRQLTDKVEQYANAGLSTGTELHLSVDQINLILAALKCAANVYLDSSSEPEMGEYSFKTVKFVKPSLGGVLKATKFIEANTSSPKDQDFPALVIAIRGTRPSVMVDWWVNFHQELRDIGDVIDFHGLCSSSQSPKIEAKVHAGFKNGALALISEVDKQVTKYLASNPKAHVIFTGHSAGGAIATLTYMHTLGKYVKGEDDTRPRLSLITFGCPPVVTPQLTPEIQRILAGGETPGVALSIINEHDPITRLDHDYVQSLLKLYDSTTVQESPALERHQRPTWQLPSPNLYQIGRLVVLKDHNPEGEESDIHAYDVDPGEFAKSIFWDMGAHPHREYERNLTELKTKLFSDLRGLEYLRSAVT